MAPSSVMAIIAMKGRGGEGSLCKPCDSPIALCGAGKREVTQVPCTGVAQPGRGSNQIVRRPAEQGAPFVPAARRAEARQSFLASLDHEMESFAKLGITDAIVRKTPVPQAAEEACLIPFRDNLEQMLPYETMLQREFGRLHKQLRDWRESNKQARPGRPPERRDGGQGTPCRERAMT